MKRFKFDRVFPFIILLSIVSLLYFQGCAAEHRGTQTIGQAGEIRSAEGLQQASSGTEAQRILQASSHRIAELVKQRPATNPFRKPITDLEKAEQERIDAEIAAIQRERAEALREVVLAENPNAQVVDRSRGTYRVPVADDQGRIQWLSGSILPIWHLQGLNPSVFFFAEAMRSRPGRTTLPANTQVTADLFLAGTSSQGAVHPYPGDIDYAEEFIVRAPNEAAAGEAMAAILAASLTRVSSNPNLEFDVLHIMPIPVRRVPGADHTWPRARILDPSQRTELARQLASTAGGRVNSDWRVLIPGGRYVVIGKIFGMHVFSSKTGERLFATQPLAVDYQEAYFGEILPPDIENLPLGEYAFGMRHHALREAKRDDYLKAAKRAFNYFRTIGNLEAMAAVTPIFASSEARITQQAKVLEAIAMALDPATPSRILPAERARVQLREAAAIMKADLPIVPGTIPGRPQGVAVELLSIASAIRGQTTDPAGIVEPNEALVERLHNLLEVEVKPMIKLSLKTRVEMIIDAYVR
jgi:hypothetical protein